MASAERLTVLFVLFFNLWISGLALRDYDDSLSQKVPRILTRSKTIRAAFGERVQLPCQVQDLGKSVLLWQRGVDVLTAQSLMVSPDHRYKLLADHTLEIRNIKPSDGGDYACKISVLGDPIEIKHTLEILLPPSIRPDPPDGNYVVKKGRKVELKCIASGNPDPTITWTRQNNLLPSGEKFVVAKSLVIDSVNRHEAGVYTCEAKNGVGIKTATASIKLQVLYPPEIELETDRVHSGENKEAHLTCIIHGNPTPSVRWYKNSMLLEETSTLRMEDRSNRHTLILSSIRSGLDFGNYSCVAENSLGTFRKHIEVHGRPTPAVFRSPPNAGGLSTYQLKWTVDSYSAIQEYRLLYRQIQPYHKMNNGPNLIQGGGDWTNVIIPGDAQNQKFNHAMTYEVSNLQTDAEYECLVQARNQFGWSEASRIFHFYTGKRELSFTDMEWKSGSSMLQMFMPEILIVFTTILGHFL